MKSSYENRNPVENNRLVPKFDENFKIVDVLLLSSNQQLYYGVH